MSGNTFGKLFKVTSCGESHGGAIAVIVDGCPSNLEISEDDIQKELDRRRPGQSALTTPRKEADKIHIFSGVFEGRTTGAPILLLAYNTDMRPEDYDELKNVFRPSHADYTYSMKYNVRDFRGSGRASARETLARVAAGAIAKKYLSEKLGIEIIAYVSQVGNIKTQIDHETVSAEQVEQNAIRCPDLNAAKKMSALIEKLKQEGDSIGGVVTGLIRKVPVGLGEPVFDKLPADLAKAMLSINAVKGFEIGSGFAGVELRGSEHNDAFISEDGKVCTATNNAGGTLGGISSGETIYFRVAFKPVSTIAKEQESIDIEYNKIKFTAKGRHDPCVVARAVPVVESMAALVIMDHYLRTKAYS